MVFYLKRTISEFLGKLNFEKVKLNEQKKELESKINQEKNKFNSESTIKKEKINDLIENFLKLEKIYFFYLYRLINKIEIDKDKNIYIYFNFSKLNSINENLDEFIKIEEVINQGISKTG